MRARNSMVFFFLFFIQRLILMLRNSVLEIQNQRAQIYFQRSAAPLRFKPDTFCVSIRGKKCCFYLYLSRFLVSTPKGQVVWRASLCSSYTSDEFIGTFREITSNPSLLPTPFPHILSTPLSLHMKPTPAFLFPSASQFYLSFRTSPIVLF